ncbi:MAG: dienelactone hydrolase family protein [Verrucomicrobiaceae bacterium]
MLSRQLILLLLAPLLAFGETLPPLNGKPAPQSLDELWAGFDPRAEPLDTETLHQWEEDDVVMRVVRFRIGTFKGQKSLLAGIYGFPKGATKLPGLLQIHGGGQYADSNAVLTNAKRGYATISISWAGRISAPGYRVNPDGVQLFWDDKKDDPNYKLITDWGALDAYHAPCRNKGNAFAHTSPHPWTLDTVDSPRNNPWFLCTLAARRALTFLEQQAEVDPARLGVYGHSMGGKLTVATAASDPRVKAAAPSCGGISDLDSKSPLYRNTSSDDQQLPRITCPIIFLSPANDFHGRLGDLPAAIGQIKSTHWRVTCAPHHNHQDTAPYEVATQLWFDHHLKGTFTTPATPKTEVVLNDIPRIKVTPDTSRPILGIDAFYTQQGSENETLEDAKYRHWHHAATREIDGTHQARLPLLDTSRPLWVYANVRYQLDQPVTGAGYYYRTFTAPHFNLSSLVHLISPDELNTAQATDQPSTLIEDFRGDWQQEWFSYRPDLNWALTTHKINDPKWAAPTNAQLSLDIRSPRPNTLVIRLDDHAAEVALTGGPDWQTITLSPADFKNANDESNLTWANAKELELSPQETLRSKNRKDKVDLGGPWTGPQPRFRNLRWLTSTNPKALMPTTQDHTHMSWTKGFPGRNPGAPWIRTIESPHFRLALNTETLEITELGSQKQPASLTLNITADGKTYTSTGGSKATRYTGPRLIESGQFFQRFDITHLTFKAKDGTQLKTDARLEVAAWTDRLSFTLLTDPPADLELTLKSGDKTLHQKTTGPQAHLALNPVTLQSLPPTDPVKITTAQPVTFHPAQGWHRINLDGIKPIGKENDVLERIPFTLTNPTQIEQSARLMFEKTRGGIKHRFGSPITGISAILRDAEGHPTGIPVQLSKNWHHNEEAGTYAGQWFHGISQIRLPAGATIHLELTLAYGHWGGVPAASHAQLSLIGWGTNTLWEQSAIGSWGESICYDPNQALADTTITDVRPLMVTGMNNKTPWGWTANIGGGDFFRFFDPSGKRLPHREIKTTRHKPGPCLTEVTYAGKIGDALTHHTTVSISRSDDLVRGTYRIRLDAQKAAPFSRFVIFQVGSDTYNFTRERKFAFGNADGLTREWDAQWGGNTYPIAPTPLPGSHPWISLHDAITDDSKKGGALGNRGIIIRSWNARLGGKKTDPYFAERGLTRHRKDSSTIDLLPPPGITALQPGDFIEATIEHLVIPQSAQDYYGPNQALRTALTQHGNTALMVLREAAGNARTLTIEKGELIHTFPDIRLNTQNGEAAFTLTNGLGYLPLTFTGLTSHRGGTLFHNGKKVDQSTHGNDFWQTNFDPATGTWSQTFNLPIQGTAPHSIRFQPGSK